MNGWERAGEVEVEVGIVVEFETVFVVVFETTFVDLGQSLVGFLRHSVYYSDEFGNEKILDTRLKGLLLKVPRIPEFVDLEPAADEKSLALVGMTIS